ncbi:MAG: NAD(+) synthase [Candidatus Anstonellales archaeon]
MTNILQLIRANTFNLIEMSKLFLKDFLLTSKISKCFIGISSGADSTLTALLCKDAGFEVNGLILPGNANESLQTKEAEAVCKKLGINYEIINISEIEQKFVEKLNLSNEDKIALGNISARIRMTILYARANSENGIVVGTGDKSEYLLGYFTKFGDAAADIFPILNMYKTQVRFALEKMNFHEIAIKEPSPQLWKGQFAEKELGISYEIADQILYALENDLSLLENFDEQDIAIVINKYKQSFHKRNFFSTFDIGNLIKIDQAIKRIVD